VSVRSLSEAERAQFGLDGGLVVLDVEKESPAAGTGLEQFDILVSCDGNTLLREEDLVQSLSVHKPGDEIRLVVQRGPGRFEKVCRVGERR
jgi:S1-C subfamily serine protease